MSNLIITIISVALVAVAAVMAIFYGGVAYENAQVSALATTMVNEAQQTLLAQRVWATNNNQPDATNVTFLTLVNAKELTVMPYGVLQQLSINYPASAYTFGYFNFNSYPGECYSYNGSINSYIQTPFTYNNGNYVLYTFYDAGCGGTYFAVQDTGTSTDQIVKLAKAVNANIGFVPTASNVMTASGLPRIAAGGTYLTTTNGMWIAGNTTKINVAIMFDANGVLQTNYCYYPYASSQAYLYISCVFGPS